MFKIQREKGFANFHRYLIMVIIFILLFVPFDNAKAEEGVSAKKLEQITSYFKEQLEQTSIPGASLTIVSDKDQLVTATYGVTKLKGEEPVKDTTSFEIGSLTKSMTAMAILQLVQQEVLTLDDLVVDHLPWFKIGDGKLSSSITIRQLLSHTSGLATNTHGVVWNDVERIRPSIIESVKELKNAKLKEEPGEEFAYANMGYAILGAVIEEVTGQSYRDYISSHVFDPLQMGYTIIDHSYVPQLDIATPHKWLFGLQTEATLGSNSPFMISAGSMTISSAPDMGNYLMEWLLDDHSTVLEESSIKDAFKSEARVENNKYYGLGWFVTTIDGTDVIYHPGGTEGSTSFAALIPSMNIGLVMLANSTTGYVTPMGMEMIDLMLGNKAESVVGGYDSQKIVSVVELIMALLALVLLVWLFGSVASRRFLKGRKWVAVLRCIFMITLFGCYLLFMSIAVTGMGLPGPFGVRGYPLDFLIGVGGVLASLGLWTVYSIVALFTVKKRTTFGTGKFNF